MKAYETLAREIGVFKRFIDEKLLYKLFSGRFLFLIFIEIFCVEFVMEQNIDRLSIYKQMDRNIDTLAKPNLEQEY